MTPRALQRLHPDLDARRLILAVRVAGLTALVLVLAQPDLPERAIVVPGIERGARALAADGALRAALAEANRRLASAPEAWASAAEETWAREAEQGGGAFLNAVLRQPASRRLRDAVDGAVRQAALHDAGGRIAAASASLPGYRFDRAPGWAALSRLPPGARHVGARGPSLSGHGEACWVTWPLHDADGRFVGALSLELDADRVRGTLCPRDTAPPRG